LTTKHTPHFARLYCTYLPIVTVLVFFTLFLSNVIVPTSQIILFAVTTNAAIAQI